MKNKRVVLTAVVLIAVMLVAMFAFTACTDDKGKGDVTVVIARDGDYKEYYVDASKVEGDGALAALEYLKDNKGLNLVTENGSYGAYITEIGDLKPDSSKNEFISIYTSVEKDFDVSEYATTVKYDGRTLTSSGLGITSMSVEEDAIIYFEIQSW